MKVKYPRTLHLPYSLSKTSDDKTLKSDAIFQGKEVVVTEKMDGENSTLYKEYYHARSLDSSYHESRSWLQNFHSQISYKFKENERICGENLYAKHSIFYEKLESYFYAFSIWEDSLCLNWDSTEARLKELGIVSVPVLYRGVYDKEKILSSFNDKMEGFVVRLASSFQYNNFSKSVAKFVRKDHVQTDNHWMHQSIKPNKLK